MPPTAEITLPYQSAPRRKEGAEPIRRRRVAAPPPSLRWRKALNFLLLFVTVVLVVDALVGDKGFMDTLHARRQSEELADVVQRIKNENVRLRETGRRLREDPAMIESVAREELGLVRPGEVLFILKDAHSVRR
jgi:cell division protein FtsB